MAKKDLKLLALPDGEKPFNELETVWATYEELAGYYKKGWKRVKKLKG